MCIKKEDYLRTYGKHVEGECVKNKESSEKRRTFATDGHLFLKKDGATSYFVGDMIDIWYNSENRNDFVINKKKDA